VEKYVTPQKSKEEKKVWQAAEADFARWDFPSVGKRAEVEEGGEDIEPASAYKRPSKVEPIDDIDEQSDMGGGSEEDGEDVDFDPSGQHANLPTAEEIEAIRQAAHEEGYTEGKALGYQEGKVKVEEEYQQLTEALKQKVRQQVQKLEGVIEQLAEPIKHSDLALEKELIDLTLALTRQVVFHHISLTPDEINQVLREGISALPHHTQKVRIYLNPDDKQEVETYLSDEPDLHWRIIDDPELTPGGCRIESDVAKVDMTVERRLEEALRKLEDESE
tara:strand:- start:5115 stop:5942 length:828 start_codon:yes stop_codon:yes gene_type:complete